MFLDYSTRSKTRSAEPYPVVKVPGPAIDGFPRRAGQADPSSSVPLVGGLQWRTRIRGSMKPGEGAPSPFATTATGSDERLLQLQRSGEGRSAVGGDEETRTPDPLLAKEMLCQLSYVPRAGG
jgi:hypothetical protein